MEQIAENLYTFPVVLPENPLKWLNCYVIRGEGGRNLLIDTGFNRPECRAALLDGIRELDLRAEDTDVFLTHLHSDHTGCVRTLLDRGARAMISGTDLDILHHETWDARKARVLAEGMPPQVLEDVFRHNPATLYSPGYFEAERLADGDLLSYGGYTLRCVATPGHTPGHLCLYDGEKQLMFLGDHVLFDITPNICFWTEMEDALGSYLDSLRKIMGYEVTLPLPGHRHRGEIGMARRAQDLLEHHSRRLAETRRIIKEHPGINAYETAGKMTWKIRARNWAEFPPGQKWFAMGEALSHVDYLLLRGEIERSVGNDGIFIYR